MVNQRSKCLLSLGMQDSTSSWNRVGTTQRVWLIRTLTSRIIVSSLECVHCSPSVYLSTHLQIKVERRPGGRLMLRHRSDNWNVVFRIRRIEQRIEAPRPRRHLAGDGQDDGDDGDSGQHSRDQSMEQNVEILLAHFGANVIDDRVDLAQSEYSKGLKSVSAH